MDNEKEKKLLKSVVIGNVEERCNHWLHQWLPMVVKILVVPVRRLKPLTTFDFDPPAKSIG